MGSNFRTEAAAAARGFRAARALETVKRIWAEARRMDSVGVQAAAEAAASELRAAGLENVKVEQLPADGTTAPGGWVLPVAWTVQEARLEVCRPGGRDRVLADYAVTPQNLALYSPGTPDGRWVEGPVVIAADARSVGRRLKGRFLFLTEGQGSFDVNEEAARAGALGVLVCIPNADPMAAHYVNYGVPLDAKRACVPCFSLAPAAGDRLKTLVQAGGDVVLRARVRARREAGTMPLVSATLGEGSPAIYVCAHLDEPGAQDNASGTAVVIEALRALRKLSASAGYSVAHRSVRVLLSTEVRGLQAWVNGKSRVPPFLAGLNLDMTGCDTASGVSPMVLRGGFRDQNHFVRHLLLEAGRIADGVVGGVTSTTGSCYVSDAVLTVNRSPGHVSIEQKVGPTYHSSADTPADLRLRTLRWSGAAAVAFLYEATRLDNQGVLRLAKTILAERARSIRLEPAKAAAIYRRTQAELESLRGAIVTPNVYGAWSKPQDLYRAGVRRKSGCWPAIEEQGRLERLISEARAACPPRPAAGRLDARQAAARREALQLVPKIAFNGFLSFEDHVRPSQKVALQKALGVQPGWGTESWAWILARHLRGKATLADVVDDLQADGITIEMDKAVRLTRYLVHDGKATLRPILPAVALRQQLKALGVRRGSILVAHCSLSGFGYVEGGSATVVQVLLDLLGPDGTLGMPTHTNSVLGAPPYNRKQTPSRVGAVTEYFRKRPGVLRSAHPTHSTAAFGPAARELTEAQRADMSPLSRSGFWGRLCDLNGDVLLLCPIRSATLFHAGEDWTQVPQPNIIAHALLPDGRRHVYTLPQAPWHVDHFDATMAQPLLRQGLMSTVPLGDGRIYRASARAMADISVQVNRDNPFVSLGKGGACACFYCQAIRDGMAARGVAEN